jgi:immune inhibitor A
MASRSIRRAAALVTTALLVTATVLPARALVSMDPKLEAQLRAAGAYDAAIRQLREARERGFFDPGELGTTKPDNAEPGKLRAWNALFILVDFTDRPATGAYGIPQWESLLLSEGTYPTGSMRDFYLENSYGSFQLTGNVVGWYRMPQPLSYYCNYDGISGTGDDYGFGGYPHNAKKLFEDAVAAADPDVDFHDFLNGYANARGIFVIHAGHGAETTGSADDIWSHMSGWSVTTADGVGCTSYSVQPELQGSGQATMGVFSHEFGHTLGLPDLYDTDGSSSGIGIWSVMSSGSWGGGGAKPVHFDAWCKRHLGFLSAPLVSVDTDALVVTPATETPVAFRLKAPAHGPDEYVLLENRRREGFDVSLPAGGLLIWHIDESMGINAIESCGPGDLHPIVRLIQADGLCELENGLGSDAGDPYPGSSGNTRFGSITVPDARAYDGEKTGILLDGITQVGSDIRLDVRLSEALTLDVPDAYTLQGALDLSGNGDEIRLRGGHAETGHFVVDAGVRISGGWDAGYQIQDPLEPSVIQGAGSNRPILEIRVGTGPVELDDLVLQGGLGLHDYQPFEARRGGAIHVTGATLQMTRTRLEGNAAGANDALPSLGGAIAAVDADVTLDACTFGTNLAKEGGAIYASGGTLTLRDVTFEGGTLYVPGLAQLQRGGALLAEDTQLSMENCSAALFTGADEGGIVHATGGSTTLRGCRLEQGDASDRGGALFVAGGSLLVQDTELVDNRAGFAGGGAYVSGTTLSWTGGAVETNHSDAGGGGLHLEDLLDPSRLASVVVRDNTAAFVGGGVVVNGGAVVLDHLVCMGNDGGYAGGAMQLVDGGSTVLRNSIFLANSGGAILGTGTLPSLDYNLYWNTANGPDVSGAVKGDHSLGADPLFVDADAGDFHLAPASLAIDAGDPLSTADFDGSPPDLGCYGGADDDGQRPAGLASVVVTSQGTDDLVTWSYGTGGTTPSDVWIFGSSSAGKGLELPELLAVVSAPATSWVWPAAGAGHEVQLQVVDGDERGGSYSDPTGPATTVDAPSLRFSVGDPFPNPFNPATQVEFTLARGGRVEAVVYDLAGRRVKVLWSGRLDAGRHALSWNGSDERGRRVGSGVYVLRLQSPEGSATRRLLLAK